MPIKKKWSPYNKDTVSKISKGQGVYEIASCDGSIGYIGRGQLQSRLSSHFLGGSDPIPQACKFRIEKLGSKKRAEQRERALLKSYSKKNKGKLPPHNKRMG